ncbi:MAG TPA: serine/threonine-protein kinase [Thermogutta sp.]|nr:serine/threonine-protein kinase [Thermogutta sp.]
MMGDSQIRPERQNTASGGSAARTAGYRLEDQPTVITSGEILSPEPATLETKGETISPTLSPGSTIGPYELLEFVGGGGMGRVFRAYDVRLSRIVALKVLTPEQATDPQILARFQNEARAAARLNHPGVVQVFSAGEHAGIHYIAFEFVEGTNLRTLVEKQGPLSVPEALHYVLQVAEALDHANRRGIIHRDIKPSNIIITPEGRAKLIDLGLARVFQQNGRSQDLTTSGMTLGTFDYIAPEQARDPRLADIRSDIYSLGCTLYFLLSGQPPFPAGSVLQKLLQHQSEEAPNIRAIRPDVPEAVARILRRMMAKSPRQRYQTPAELIQALRAVLGVEVQTVQFGREQQRIAEKKRLPLRQHLPWLVPVVGLLLSTLVLDWWWSQGAEETIYFGDDVRYTEGLFSPLTPTPPGYPAAGQPEQPQGKPTDSPIPPDRSSPSRTVPNQTELPSATSESGQVSEIGIARVRGAPVDSLESPIGSTAVSGSAFSYPQGQVAPAMGHSSGFEENKVLPDATVSSQDPVPFSSSTPSDTGIPRVVTDMVTRRTPVGTEHTERFSPALSMSAEWVRTVDPTTQEPGSYPTLEAACQAALPGDEIRLNFDGPLPVEGCDLRGRQLIIKAAKGRLPELVFHASEQTKLRSGSFWTLAASSIVCEDVAIRIEVPPEYAADDWHLFRVSYDSTIELNRCVLTLAAARDRRQIASNDVNVGSFFLFCEDPRSALVVRAAQNREADQLRGTAVRLHRCIIRGDGDLFRSTYCQPVRVTITESFVSVAGRLLDMLGTERSPASDAGVHLELQRLTAWTAKGLIRQQQLTYQPYLQPIRVESEHCIFVASPNSALIEQHVPNVDGALRLLTWFGQRNFYEQFSQFWLVVTGAQHSVPLQLSFDQWKAYWQTEHEQEPAWGAIPWQAPLPLDVPPHLHRPSDFAIMDPSWDDIASDIANRAGCPVDQLPFVPSR